MSLRGDRFHNVLQAEVFKLTLCAQRTWRRLNGLGRMAELIEGVKFEDGIKVEKIAA